MESDCSMVGVTIKAEEPLHMQSEQESDFSWVVSHADIYGGDQANATTGTLMSGLDTNKEEDFSDLYSSFPVYEYIIYQSKSKASEDKQNSSPYSRELSCANQINLLLSSLELLIKNIKTLVENTCTLYPSNTEEAKPNFELNDQLISQQNSKYININDTMSSILGISSSPFDVTQQTTKDRTLFVSDIAKLETEYSRCSSVINTVIQMINYKETLLDDSPGIQTSSTLQAYNNDIETGVDQSPESQEYDETSVGENPSYIYKQTNSDQPKLNKTKKRTSKTRSQVNKNLKITKKRFDVPDKLKTASNEAIGQYIRKKFIEKPPAKANRQLGYDPEFCITENEYNDLLLKGSPYSCIRCQRVFVERRSLENHLIGLCVGKAFEWKDLQPNFKEENEIFHCLFPGCTTMVKPSGGKNGRTAPIYRHHQEAHLVGVECPYKCKAPGCGMTFFMKGLLGEHTRETHQKVRFCDICGKGISAFQLGIHMRRHTGEKPHKCNYCDYRAVEKGIVNKHIKEVHAMEKHFCDLCGKNYKSKNSLRDHLKTHSDTPPFSCKECGRGFKHRQNLRRHLAVIHKLKHTCNICKAGEFSASELREHRQKVHNMELIAFAVSKRSYEAKLDKPVTS